MKRVYIVTTDAIVPWEINQITRDRIFDSSDMVMAFKYFRRACSAYIAKPAVRNHIFARDGSYCVFCGREKQLQIDHIHSVFYCFKEKLFEYVNSPENLQTLCGRCNVMKS